MRHLGLTPKMATQILVSQFTVSRKYMISTKCKHTKYTPLHYILSRKVGSHNTFQA